eukprot:Tamp_34559.p1 GENE.Tamp_34559~~Tamp_34559.p1  ORF type:complete len:127 (-),score=13.01 Tamp_34559:132-512(-)
MERRFKCDQGLVVLPVSKVNDDYCDCEDGSDELGTSACANNRFECTGDKMSGGKFYSIFSSRVNDGVCDCCDGQDEKQNPLLSCPNRCQLAPQKRRGQGGIEGSRWMGRKASFSLFQGPAAKKRPH